MLTSSSLSSRSPRSSDAGPLMKPIGSAYLEATRLQEGGFEGALPLYDQNKRKIQISLDVKVTVPRSETESLSEGSEAPLAIPVSIEDEVMGIQPAGNIREEDGWEELEIPILGSC